MSQMKIYILFFMYYVAIRRRKLLATVRVELSIVVTYIWSPSNWSERCPRTIRCQKTRIISKNRYGMFVGVTKASSRVSKTKVPYR